MRCESIIDRVLHAKGDSLPLVVRFHILHCSHCRKEADLILKRDSSMRGFYPFEAPMGLVDTVMRSINLGEVPYKSSVSSEKWLGAGVILFLSIFLASYSDTRVWLTATYGDLFEVPFNIVMGIAITSYAVLFIGTHLDRLRAMAVVSKMWGCKKL
jgi:hypothetical protein